MRFQIILEAKSTTLVLIPDTKREKQCIATIIPENGKANVSFTKSADSENVTLMFDANGHVNLIEDK